MAEIVDPNGNASRLYQQLSHIAHPRTSYPYSTAEGTTRKKLKIGAREYFVMRRNNFVPIAVDALNHICDVCERELKS